MRGAEFLAHFGIRLGAGVGIGDEQGNRRAERTAFVNAGDDADGVGLLALGGQFALARAAAVEVGLNVGHAERQVGRAAVDDDADPAPMALAPDSNREKLAENIAHKGPIIANPRLGARADKGMAGSALVLSVLVLGAKASDFNSLLILSSVTSIFSIYGLECYHIGKP